MTADQLRDYAWRERSLGVAQPLTWAQKLTMRQLITSGRAEPLPMAEQRCWVTADLLRLAHDGTGNRCFVLPDGRTRIGYSLSNSRIVE